MIKHVVMWTVAGDNRAEKIENATKVKVAYEGLRGRIPGLNHIEVGMDFSRAANACDIILYSEFTHPTDLVAYGSHPEKLKASSAVQELCVLRQQVDYFA